MAKFESRILTPAQIEMIRSFKEDTTIAHRTLKDTVTRLINAILAPIEPIVFLVGATGTGKSTLSRKVLIQLIEYSLTDPSFHPGRMASVMIALSGDSTFNWKMYFTRTLTSLQEILIDKKVHYTVETDNLGRLLSKTTNTQYTLEDAYINTLLARQPYSVFLDEAQHVLKKKRTETNRMQMDRFKSLADRSKTTHVLIGTHELLNLIDNEWSAQLDRRSVIIQLDRYMYDESDEDKEEYKKILRTIPLKLPIKTDFDFQENADYFARNTLGVIGMLWSWIARGMRSAFEEDRDYLSADDMKKTIVNDHRLKNRLIEIQNGEKKLVEFLDINADDSAKPQLISNADNANQKKTKGKVYPGRRKPGSDPIGLPFGNDSTDGFTANGS